MRVMMALLLGLYLVVPARAEAAPGYRCADFLEEAGLRPEGLEYLFCRPATEPRTGRRTLTARYRVPGPQAAAVETALRERTGMAALERQMGIWQLPEGGEGRFVLRQSTGEGRPGGQMAGTFFSVQGLRDGLSGDGATGSEAGTLPSAGRSVPAAQDDGMAGAAGSVGSPAAVPGAAAKEGTAALADSAPKKGPSCTVSMGEVPQQGTFAPQREDWGKVSWFAVTVRLELPR